VRTRCSPLAGGYPHEFGSQWNRLRIVIVWFYVMGKLILIMVVCALGAPMTSGQTPLPPVDDRPVTPGVEIHGGISWHLTRAAALAEAARKKRDVFVYAFDSL